MSDQIELHDSNVYFRTEGDALVLHLCPAYVHHWEKADLGWIGVGRLQAAIIVVEQGSMGSTFPEETVEIADGYFQVGDEVHDNLLPVGLAERGEVQGKLEFVNADPATLKGTGIRIWLHGDPKDIEELPREWAPSSETA